LTSSIVNATVSFNDNIDKSGLVSVADVIKFRDNSHKLAQFKRCEYSHELDLYVRIGSC